MEKQRQIKILSIVALVLAISAMTLGFAAFSTTLSISSSATVTPSSDDFKIKMYGFKSQTALSSFYSSYVMQDSYLSETIVLASGSTDGHDNGRINNTTHTINGLNANFTEPGEFVYYHVIIRNEGKYDAYINWNNYGGTPSGYTLGEGTTESLVQDAMNDIELSTYVTDLSGMVFGSNILPAGETIIAIFQINYDASGARADGPFSVSFPDIKIDFRTNNVDLISFTIDGETFYAEEGMSWGDWVNSQYSQAMFYISSNLVKSYSGDYIGYSSGRVTESQIIVDSGVYNYTSGGTNVWS